MVITPSFKWPASGFRVARTLATPALAVAPDPAGYRLLGSGVHFVVKKVQGGVEVSPRQGTTPAVLKVTAPDRRARPFSFLVERPDTRETATVSGLLVAADWDVKYYAWDPARELPLASPAAWQKLIAGQPLDEHKASRIDFDWGLGAPTLKVPANHFALVATTELELPAGKYELCMVSLEDTGVFIDGVKVLNCYMHSPIFRDFAHVHLKEGKHTIRIEHHKVYRVGLLQFAIRPVK